MTNQCQICLKPTAYFIFQNDKQTEEIITICHVCRAEKRKIDNLKKKIDNMQAKRLNMSKKLYQPRITEHEFRISQLEAEIGIHKICIQQIHAEMLQ